ISSRERALASCNLLFDPENVCWRVAVGALLRREGILLLMQLNCSGGDLLYKQDLLAGINLEQLYLNNLTRGGLHCAPNKDRFDRQFAMPAINQHAQLNAAWTSVIEQSIQCGPRCAPGVKDVVHKNDVLVAYVKL